MTININIVTEEQYREIAHATIGTYSIYELMDGEHDDRVYLINVEDNFVSASYNSYKELVEALCGGILDDVYDSSTVDENGEWNFYLTEEQLLIVMAL